MPSGASSLLADEAVGEHEHVPGTDRDEEIALPEAAGEDLLGAIDVDEPFDPLAGRCVGCRSGDV
ncbi:MAG TPA: hypothetical protein VFS26_04155, partial [Solirubrobacterales bacterium]|nr:hypothetical protein [Solirubrobacterales bacterium]